MKAICAEGIIVLELRVIREIPSKIARARLTLIENPRAKQRLPLDIRRQLRQSLSSIKVIFIQVLPTQQRKREIFIPVSERERVVGIWVASELALEEVL